MCEDCGCQEGNERAYFANQKNHSPDHSHEHSHDHSNDHAHVHRHDNGEIHIHIHIDSDAQVHVHSASHGHGSAHTHVHDHAHEHAHEHAHVHQGHSHSHSHNHKSFAAVSARTKTIAIETSVLAKNDAQAAKNRQWLKDKGVVAVNLISSPGSGKTFLLEKTLDALQGKIPCAVITGDMQTDNDAQRMMGKGAPVVQIETRSACHLNAEQIEAQLEKVVNDGAKLLFIENVGNLVCPAAFDLGEQQKIALVSVAEGEDKPVKYPVLFHGAAVTLLTKIDLLPHLEVNIENYKQSVLKVQPGARIIDLSAKTGQGMDAWLAYLDNLVSNAK